MKSLKVVMIGIAIVISSCEQKATIDKERIKQAFVEHSPTKHHEIALEVLSASKEWINQFNNGNIEACVNRYDENAVMSAMPFGVKKGKAEILEFWRPFINSGATNLVYTNVSIEVANASTVFLSADWSMNVGRGVIYQEKWEKKGGEWKYTYDNFKVVEQFETPKENVTNPVASHLVLEKVIKASIDWTKGFNSGKGNICGDGYSNNASMNAIPFASFHNKKDIGAFWSKLISDGANNLTYHNPIFIAKTDNSAILSSQWSMNIGEGKIYEEKWENIEGKWLLTYDEFEVLKQY